MARNWSDARGASAGGRAANVCANRSIARYASAWSDRREARPGEPPASPPAEERIAIAAIPFHGVGLAEGVTLLLAAGRPLHDDDVAALRAAAAPLLKLLHKRRLTRPRDERG